MQILIKNGLTMRQKIKHQVHQGDKSYLCISRADFGVEISEAIAGGNFRRLSVNQATAKQLINLKPEPFCRALREKLDHAQRTGNQKLFLHKA